MAAGGSAGSRRTALCLAFSWWNVRLLRTSHGASLWGTHVPRAAAAHPPCCPERLPQGNAADQSSGSVLPKTFQTRGAHGGDGKAVASSPLDISPQQSPRPQCVQAALAEPGVGEMTSGGPSQYGPTPVKKVSRQHMQKIQHFSLLAHLPFTTSAFRFKMLRSSRPAV